MSSHNYSFDDFKNITIDDDFRFNLHRQGFVQIHLFGAAPANLRPFDIQRWFEDLKGNGGKIVKSHGIIGGYGAGGSPSAWAARLLMFPFYRAFYGTDNLRCSLDGLNYTEPNANLAKADSWVHCDESHTRQGHSNWADLSLQSVVQVFFPSFLIW